MHRIGLNRGGVDALERDAVVVAEINHGVAMRIGAEVVQHIADAVDIAELVELDGIADIVALGIRDGGEIHHRIGADAWMEHELVVTETTDRNRDGLRNRGIARIAHRIGLRQTHQMIELGTAGGELPFDRSGACDSGHHSEIVRVGWRDRQRVTGVDVGGTNVVGIYRVDGPESVSVIADIGQFNVVNPPTVPFDLPTGFQFPIEPYRGGFLVTDANLNRVLRVTLDGEISVFIDFDNIVPTGLAVTRANTSRGRSGSTAILGLTGALTAESSMPKHPSASKSGSEHGSGCCSEMAAGDTTATSSARNSTVGLVGAGDTVGH